jgi:MFS family permease
MEIDYLKLRREKIVSVTPKTYSTALLLFALSLLLLIVVVAIDAIYNPIDYTMLVRERDNAPFWKKLISKLILERKPVLDSLAFLRTILLLCSGLFMVGSITQLPRTDSIDLSQATLISGMQANAADAVFTGTFKKLVMGIILLSSFFFLVLFLVDPVGFSTLGSEDQPIELLSALFYFISFGLFVYTMVLLSKQWNHRKLYLLLAAVFAFGFFIMGMEEISWFQRVLNIETPDTFKDNRQKELNLHNFFTNPLENAFYFASFVFLILIPFVHENFRLIKNQNLLSVFIPSRFILFASAIFVAYNYDMWNILFTQLAFFVTFFILGYYAWLYIRMRNNAGFVVALLIIYTLSQVLFIIYGDNFVRLFDVTEYKEIFIPLGFLLYSLEVVQRMKGVNKERAYKEGQ